MSFMDAFGQRRAGGSARGHIALACAAAFLIIATFAPRADAFTSGPLWLCRSSALGVSVMGNNKVEPVLANGNPNTANGANPDRAQCTTQDVGANNLATPLAIPADFLAAQTATAQTSIDPELGKAIDQKATAVAKVENLTLRLPPGAQSVALGVGAAQATATASCVNGAPQLTGTSQATGITLGGQTVSLDQLLSALGQGLQPLGALVTLKVNEQVKTANSLIQRALHITLLSAAGNSPLADIIIGEAKVGNTDDVCDPNKQFPGQTPDIRPCPKGSDFDAPSGNCIISASSGNPTAVVVGKPFQGPSGGTVVSLTEARKKYKSPCLSGPGPKYVVVGTNKADRITGTNLADRILGRGGNDALDGGRGSDCVDGGTGGDNISGGLGNDRMYGLSGKDHLNGGPGNDRLSAGSGNDTVNAAYGRDVVYGGAGRDFINVATAGPPARVSCGSGFDKVRINQKERRRIRGCEVSYVFRDK
jgi:hypothetical protein